MVNSAHNHRNKPLFTTHAKWKLNGFNDWGYFEKELDKSLVTWSCDNFNTVDEAWTSWKDIVTEVGERVVGKKLFQGHASRIYDSEISKLIKSRKVANRFYRHWSRKGLFNPDLVQDLWQEYWVENLLFKEKSRQNLLTTKVKVIKLNCQKGTKNTRAYWRMLKRLNGNNGYPLRISDPKDSSRTIDDPEEICRTLREYWSNMSKNNEPDSAK